MFIIEKANLSPPVLLQDFVVNESGDAIETRACPDQGRVLAFSKDLEIVGKPPWGDNGDVPKWGITPDRGEGVIAHWAQKHVLAPFPDNFEGLHRSYNGGLFSVHKSHVYMGKDFPPFDLFNAAVHCWNNFR